MTAELRTLIVDDEPLALRRLEMLLSEIPDVAVVGRASSCAEARHAVRALAPDVLLLDIRMRDGTGFDLLAAIGPERRPEVIFVTAFDQFAIEAFENAAVDYLLKPIDPARLRRALDRARITTAHDSAYERIGEMEEVIANLRSALRQAPDDRQVEDLWIRSANGSFVRIALGDIDWIESEEDYVRLHTGTTSHLLRSSIVAIQAKLDPTEFVRVHRSALVRLASIARVGRKTRGQREVILHNGARIPAGRIHFRAMRALLQKRNLLADA